MFSILLQIQQNLTEVKHGAAEELVKQDPYGILMALMSITIVMVVLSCIYIILKTALGFIQKLSSPKKEKDTSRTEIKLNNSITGETAAAIATALHLYIKELHETEYANITIKKIKHNYSPWSSKIHTIRQLPKRF